MTPNQRNLLLLSGGLALAGFVFGWPRLSATQRSLTLDLVNLGLVGTLIGVPIGLWSISRFPDRPWLSAAFLTAASFAVKAVLLPHETHEEAGVAGYAARELEAAY